MTTGPSSAAEPVGARRLLRQTLRADWAWLAFLLLLGTVYLFGLGSAYAPTNGDEMVYIHIAHMTSASGHWLPLQSELTGMRNTKPPLLIWQAMVAGDWGRHWTLLALRLPSVIYGFATAALVGFFSFRLSGKRHTAYLAAGIYLLYFSSFRYGRVYLTSAPETFWLALPMWWLLWLRLRAAGAAAAHLSWRAFTAFGVAMGVGAAYKSFALLAPAGAALWCAYLLGETRLRWRTLLRLTLGTSWSVLLGLALFASWFALDPQPGAVWQEFVIGENAAKMHSTEGYWQAALYGTYPMWTQLLAYPVNAGLLAGQTLGFFWYSLVQTLRHRTRSLLTPAHWVLLAWLLVWLVVFTIPSQRSERYVIPAMPALAIAMALTWQHIGRIWTIAGLLLAAPALLILGRIAWVMGALNMDATGWHLGAVALAACGLLVVLTGLFCARYTRTAGLLACLAIYGCFNLMVAPLSQAQNDFSPAHKALLAGRRLAVPNGFTGQYENYRFTFPASSVFPYDSDGRNTGERYPELAPELRLQRLLGEFDAVIWRQDQSATAPCLPQCQVLDQRWHVRSRHKDGEIRLDNLWYPQTWLFNQEWLLTSLPP